MKQASGAGGLPGADDDDFTVVSVESTSESAEQFQFLKILVHWCFTLYPSVWRSIKLTSKLRQLMELHQVKVHQRSVWVHLECMNVCAAPFSPGKKARILDAEGLALGCEIASSKKKARDLMDGSFHRSGPLVFTFRLIHIKMMKPSSKAREHSFLFFFFYSFFFKHLSLLLTRGVACLLQIC